jgi:hypothetical protein
MKVIVFALEDWEREIFDSTDEHDLLITVAILDNVLEAVAQALLLLYGMAKCY